MMEYAKKKFDVFISYRRDDGYETARLIYDRLSQRRYNVSFDLETLRGGKFTDEIFRRIENCSDVLAVMSKETLKFRSNRDDDWFRLEIAHAIKCGKNIVPVFLRDFDMPKKEDLPEDIAQLVEFNGVTASHEHFDSAMEKICDKFQCKPRRRLWPFVVASVAILLAIAGAGIATNAKKIFPYPYTTAQKKLVGTLSGNMALLCSAYNDYLLAQKNLLDVAETSIKAGRLDKLQEESPIYMIAVERAKIQTERATSESAAFIDKYRDMPLDYAGMPIFFESHNLELATASGLVSSLERICNPKVPMEVEDRYSVVNSYKEELKIRSDLFSVSIMGVFLEISETSIADLKKVCRECQALDMLHNPWLRVEKDIEDKGYALCNKLEEIINKRTILVGDMNKDLANEKGALIKQMQELGTDDEFIQKVLRADMAYANLMTAIEARESFPEKEAAIYRNAFVEAGGGADQADRMIAKMRKLAGLKKELKSAVGESAEIEDKARNTSAKSDLKHGPTEM